MNKSYVELKKEYLKDPEFKKEYDALEPEYDFIIQLHEATTEKDYSWNDLAEKSGINKTKVNKIILGTHSPSIRTMYKLAIALDRKLKIELVDENI